MGWRMMRENRTKDEYKRGITNKQGEMRIFIVKTKLGGGEKKSGRSRIINTTVMVIENFNRHR